MRLVVRVLGILLVGWVLLRMLMRILFVWLLRWVMVRGLIIVLFHSIAPTGLKKEGDHFDLLLYL